MGLLDSAAKARGLQRNRYDNGAQPGNASPVMAHLSAARYNARASPLGRLFTRWRYVGFLWPGFVGIRFLGQLPAVLLLVLARLAARIGLFPIAASRSRLLFLFVPGHGHCSFVVVLPARLNDTSFPWVGLNPGERAWPAQDSPVANGGMVRLQSGNTTHAPRPVAAATFPGAARCAWQSVRLALPLGGTTRRERAVARGQQNLRRQHAIHVRK